MKYDDAYWQRQIDSIMDNFEFDRVHECMTALNWEWAHCGGVPDKPELRRSARDTLRGCVDKNLGGTGGFMTMIDREKGVLTLMFVVSDWDAYED